MYMYVICMNKEEGKKEGKGKGKGKGPQNIIVAM